jgi:hypothetical protein
VHAWVDRIRTLLDKPQSLVSKYGNGSCRDFSLCSSVGNWSAIRLHFSLKFLPQALPSCDLPSGHPAAIALGLRSCHEGARRCSTAQRQNSAEHMHWIFHGRLHPSQPGPLSGSQRSIFSIGTPLLAWGPALDQRYSGKGAVSSCLMNPRLAAHQPLDSSQGKRLEPYKRSHPHPDRPTCG